MNLDELTIGQAKEISAFFGKTNSKEDHPYTVGKPWFIRTVTHHLTGVIKSVGTQEIVLQGGTVMWVASDGRFTDLFNGIAPPETEVYGENDVVIGRGAIIDASELGHLIEVCQR